MLYRRTANYSSSALFAKSRFLPIPVRTENIVPVFAMGSTERKWLMEKEHYHKIITYQTTVSILKSWMRAGLVTPEEFQKINTIIAERSGLSLCSIFLDSCPIVQVICHRKGGDYHGTSDTKSCISTEKTVPVETDGSLCQSVQRKGCHAPFSVGTGQLLQSADPEQSGVAVLRCLCR